MVKSAVVGLLVLPSTSQAALDVVMQRYTCERGVEVPVVYVNDGDKGSIANLMVEGGLFTLYLEPSASGARYGWPSDGSGYVWWTKGDAATLLWKDGAAGTETALLSDCVATQ
jgi:membrane-bound inhibitor of C-type lysozyme